MSALALQTRHWCPTCGHEISVINDAETLASTMRERQMDCYEGRDGRFYLSRGGGPVSRVAINQALHAGWIKPKWDERPDLPYWRAA